MASIRQSVPEGVSPDFVVAGSAAIAVAANLDFLPTPANGNREVISAFDACCGFVDGVMEWVESELQSSRVSQLDRAFLATGKGMGYR
jgi:hypothetical protein